MTVLIAAGEPDRSPAACAAVLVLLVLSLLLSSPADAAAERQARLVAAGDVGCAAGQVALADACRAQYTGALVASLDPDAVAVLGDITNGRGSLASIQAAYHPFWGQFLPITRPAIGNHEYLATPERSSAPGYFAYFGAAAGAPDKGYYTYELGGWRIIVLNSGTVDLLRVSRNKMDDCFPVSCGPRSRQVRWLRGVLRRDPPERCVMAYWHIPRYSSGVPGSAAELRHAYKALYDHGAELVLSGHAHNYERFAEMDAGARRRKVGVRQFVVGTGGARQFALPKRRRRGSQFFDRSKSFGVLNLNLSARGYSYRFLREDGATVDKGAGRCHGKPPAAKERKRKKPRQSPKRSSSQATPNSVSGAASNR